MKTITITLTQEQYDVIARSLEDEMPLDWAKRAFSAKIHSASIREKAASDELRKEKAMKALAKLSKDDIDMKAVDVVSDIVQVSGE